MDISTLQSLVEAYISEKNLDSYFWVDGRIKDKKVEVFIDSDDFVSFEVCREISRYIESVLDESQSLGEDYTLEVSSAGVGSPLRIVRQYHKNIGRMVEVKYDNKKIKGTLVQADHEKIGVEAEVVEMIGKKKKKVMVVTDIPYDMITEARVKVSFK